MTNTRLQARRLIAVMQRGDDEGMVLELARLTADRAHGGRESHLIVGELVSGLTQMMLAAAGPGQEAQERTYGLELTGDDHGELDIDQVSPPIRAAVRALLAELNGHSAEALFQVDLALRDTSLKATIEVFAHVVLWTAGMVEWCDRNNVPRPQWLGGVASTHRATGRDE